MDVQEALEQIEKVLNNIIACQEIQGKINDEVWAVIRELQKEVKKNAKV